MRCAARQCGRPVLAKKFCSLHYQRWKKHGDHLVRRVAGKTHGHAGNNRGGKRTRTSEYHSWASMLSRCRNPNSTYYSDYGARGITVCGRWIKFQNFLDDMGTKPSPDHELERKDNNGGYCPENCKWGTQREQARNRRTSRVLRWNGTSATLAEWGEITGLNPNCISRRIKRGWSIIDALTKPARITKRYNYV